LALIFGGDQFRLGIWLFFVWKNCE
jgi:hypothetical protein